MYVRRPNFRNKLLFVFFFSPYMTVCCSHVMYYLSIVERYINHKFLQFSFSSSTIAILFARATVLHEKDQLDRGNRCMLHYNQAKHIFKVIGK